MKRIVVAFGIIAFPLVVSPSAVPAAPAPDVYDVQISYRINAFRNERLLQYAEMMRFLKKAGFQRDPEEIVPETEPEDVTRTRLRGTIPARRARALVNERHIHSILLLPHGVKPPEDKTKLVRVEIELNHGLTPEGQQQLSEQTFEVLAGIQFRGAVGYDRRGYTRLIGSMPFNRVETLLTDLRQQPAGEKMPKPFRGVWAVRVAEVRPDVPPPVPRPRPPQVAKGQEKLSPDLREVLAGAEAAKPMRLEVILAGNPAGDDKSYRSLLKEAAPGLIVEGRLGPLVSVVVDAKQAPALAALSEVAAVRLPRRPQFSPLTPNPSPPLRGRGEKAGSPLPRSGGEGLGVRGENWRPLRNTSGTARLQSLGHQGRGTRLALIDGDFRGWQALVGKGLPADTYMFDFTRERNADMQPDAFPAGKDIGAGTRRALAIARLAPQINLTLIRLDPAAPYMLETAARAINGDSVRSINLEHRLMQLEVEQDALDKRREALTEERRLVFQDFRQEGEAVKRREEYRKKQEIFDSDNDRFHATLQRYLQYKRDLTSLRGIRVVASALTWHDGFPVDGSSALSRYFDDRPFRAALWFQAVGDTRGQSWSGLFRDADNNGVLEFAAAEPRPLDSWTPELNFLSWQPAKGPAVTDIPAGTHLRLTLQWREAHDPLFARSGEDPYRLPLARGVRLLLLRQLDPAGARQPIDDLEVVAQSVGVPQRLAVSPSSAVYEVILEIRVKDAGRYAVRVEGHAPTSIYPPGDPALPFARKHSEMRVRLFVSSLDAKGRAIFRDYRTATGSIGIPADARTTIAVGASDERDHQQPYSAGGAPFNLALLSKPDVLTRDHDEGTAQAAALAAVLTAMGRSPGKCRPGLHVSPHAGMCQADRGR